jgi:hypothetical protein
MPTTLVRRLISPLTRSMGLAETLALLTGLVGLTGLGRIAAHFDFGLGRGGVEPLTAYLFRSG